MNPWTEDETGFVIDNANKLNNNAMGFLIGRSYKAISHCLTTNNVSRSPEFIAKLLNNGTRQIGDKNPGWKGGISKNHYHYKKLQIKRYPERVKARQTVRSAVRSGKLIKQPCEVCGTTENIQSHHEDYSKPLEVKWLCRKHHKDAEKTVRELIKR